MGKLDHHRWGRRRWALPSLGIALAAILAVVLAGVGSDDPSVDPARRTGSGGGASAGKSAPDLGAAPSPDGATLRGPDGSLRRQAIDGAGPRTLRARCVRAEDGAPLEEVEWRWDVTVGGAQREYRRACGSEFVADLDAAATRLHASVAAAGRVSLRCRIDLRGGADADAGADSDIDLGELRLRAGTRVLGSLADAAGVAQPGASVRLVRIGPEARTGPMLERVPDAVDTAADGGFELDSPVSPGAYDVHVREAPRLVTEPRITIVKGQAETRLDLVCVTVAPEDRISGSVFDPSGEPLADASVKARHEDGRITGIQARSRADGSFVLYRPAHVARDETMVIAATTFDSAAQASGIECKWGRADLPVVMRRPGRLRVEVVSAATGEPIPAFAVRCIPSRGPSSSADARLRADGAHHEGGAVWLTDLGPGPHVVVVHPRDRWAKSCVPSLPVDCEVPESGDGVLRVALHESRRLECELVHEDGVEVAGSRVELFALHRTDSFVAARSRMDLREHRGSGGPVAVRLDSTRSDAGGRARLEWCVSPRRLTLRVTGRHPEVVREGLVFAREGEPVRVVVPRGARLHGSITPARLFDEVHRLTPDERTRLGFLAQHEGKEARARFWSRIAAGLVLVETGGAARRLPATRRFPIGEDGRFSIEGIPAGEWAAYLERRSANGPFVESARPLARLKLREGETRGRDFDVRDHVAAGTLSGVVAHNGGPAVGLEVLALTPMRGGSHRIAARGRCDASGRFRFSGLAPRTYWFAARIGDTRLPLSSRFELGPGARRAATLELRTRPVRLRLQAAKVRRGRLVLVGETARGLPIKITHFAAPGTTRCEMPHVPPGKYRIVGSDVPPIEVGPGRDAQEFVRRP